MSLDRVFSFLEPFSTAGLFAFCLGIEDLQKKDGMRHRKEAAHAAQALRRHCEGEREALLRSLRAIHEAAAVLTRDSWWGEAEKGTSELNATLAKHASSW